MLLLGLCIVVCLLTLWIAERTFIGPDFYFTYYATGSKWLGGEGPLYGLTYEQADVGFYNAPWLLLILVPTALLPLALGQAIWHVASGLLLIGSAHVWTRPQVSPVWIALSIANLFTVDLLLRGQIDALLLAGVMLGWLAVREERPWQLSAAFAILLVKPPNVLLVMLLFSIAARRWSRRQWAIIVSVPLLLAVGSGVFVGFDWPLAYLRNAQQRPIIDYLSITLWRALDLLGLAAVPFVVLAGAAVAAFVRRAWRVGMTQQTVCIALATNLVFTTYANGNHYVLLIPVFLYVAQRNWRWGIAAYAASWSPLLRLPLGYEAAVVDLVYTLILWAGAWRWPDAAQAADQTSRFWRRGAG